MCICTTGDPCDYHAVTCITCHPKCQGHPELNDVVGYRFLHEDGRLDCEAVLSSAKAKGLIIEYDDGRDRDPWFNYVRGVDVSELKEIFLEAGYTIKRDDQI